MRNMSFMLTTKAMYEHRKTVTRRLGWWNLKAGDVVMAIEKGQGLKKGEHPVKIYPIRILSTRKEQLNWIAVNDVIAEGFPELSINGFVDMFCKHNKCERWTEVNRIEFEELEQA